MSEGSRIDVRWELGTLRANGHTGPSAAFLMENLIKAGDLQPLVFCSPVPLTGGRVSPTGRCLQLEQFDRRSHHNVTASFTRWV